MNRALLSLVAGTLLLVLPGCTAPPASNAHGGGAPGADPTPLVIGQGVGFLQALAELGKVLAPSGPPEPAFKIVSTGYDFEPKYCTYFIVAPMIPSGKRGHITIQDNENPAGGIEVFVTPESSNWDPTVTPRPPGNPFTMNGNGHTSAPGPGILTIHLKTNRPAPRVNIEIDN